MKNVKFQCPKCGRECEIEEVLCDAVVSSTVKAFNEMGDVDYSSYGAEIFDGQIERFQCSACGYVIRQDDGSEDVVNDYADLYFLGARQGWIREEESC